MNGVVMDLGCAGNINCPCTRPLGSVSDYDVIIIAGKKYSASELYDKKPTVTAGSDVNVYTGAYDDAPVKYVTKAGNIIGKYYSYLLPKAGRKDAWVELQTGPETFVFVKNEALSSNAIADQGVKTVQQQLKEEEDQKNREADPVGYYLKKFGLPALLIGGAIYLAATYGKELIKTKILKA